MIEPATLAVVAACLLLWGLVSARLERINITGPIAFVVLGLLANNQPLSVVDLHLRSSTVRAIVEITLALVLFADASRVQLRALRADAAFPGRLLGIGLPLTVGLGTIAGLLVAHGNWWIAAIIGAAVAPTDAALGAAIMQDERVPGRVRTALNVESGLNDGIATPLVTFFVAGALTEEVAHAPTLGEAAAEIAIGVGLGIAIGALGALLMNRAIVHGWTVPALVPVIALGLALLAYAGTIAAGGNGFVGAFVGGLAFGSVRAKSEIAALEFTDDLGEVLSLVVWFLFGSTMIVYAFKHLEWSDVVFAVLALTLVRMVPVAIALAGTGLDRATVAFVGWFGPRGLASVVFALIAVDSLEPKDGNRVLAVVMLTILMSVVAHGVTAGPFAARYGARSARLRPEDPEHAPTAEVRVRRRRALRAR